MRLVNRLNRSSVKEKQESCKISRILVIQLLTLTRSSVSK